ncbi:hypothetical protein Mapa_001233 [Marchantia paleacea]|nr:hypothetical protein Mapa_001233 [Marchantia paleacea]
MIRLQRSTTLPLPEQSHEHCRVLAGSSATASARLAAEESGNGRNTLPLGHRLVVRLSWIRTRRCVVLDCRPPLVVGERGPPPCR